MARKPNIEVISASAGTGKTFTLVERLYTALTSEGVRPQAVIGTTFTVAAAQELTERVRVKLFNAGNTDLALAVRQANFGTVNSVCDYLVRRYAFSAGISPELEVIGESEQQAFFAAAVSDVLSPYEEQMTPICRRFGFYGRHRGPYDWKNDVKALVGIIRTNNLTTESLNQGRDESIKILKEILGKPAKGTASDFNTRLREVISQSISDIEAVHDEDLDNVKNAVLELQKALRSLESGFYTYSDLDKLAAIRIKSRTKAIREKYLPMTEAVTAAAGNYRAHPQLHADIEEYIANIYALALKALNEYNEFKKARGLIDFIDQEVHALKILDNPDVQNDISANLDLLLVDEFQDTSPLQLAIFLKLSALARRSIWVGDPKQSIYGFREADPRLMAAVVSRFDTGESKNILSDSWRSRPALVGFFNRYFSEVFAGEFAPERVKLNVKRKNARENEKAMGAALNVLHLNVRNNGEYYQQIAAEVKKLLESEIRIDAKDDGTLRAIKGKDIAMLCRTNDECRDLTQALSASGVETAIAASGLYTTAEGKMFLAALRLVIDKRDSLARAELRVLDEGKREDVSWLESRLDFVAKRKDEYDESWLDEHPLVAAVLNLSQRALEYTVCEMTNAIIEALDLRAIAMTWPTGRQRVANIDLLRAYAAEFEEQCRQTKSPSSLSAFYLYLTSLSADGTDMQAMNPSEHAVNVMTYHGAKGLEWPVVFLQGLGSEARNPFWGFSVIDRRKEIDLENILAERRPLFFPWFMGATNRRVDWLQGEVEKQPLYPQLVKEALDEEKRLLYVGMTRARDYLFFPLKNGAHDWIVRCNPGRAASYSFLANANVEELETDQGKIHIAHTRDFEMPVPEAAERQSAQWFTKRTGKLEFPAYFINPSQQESVTPDRTLKVMQYGKRLTISGKPEMDILGTALHAFLAADRPGLSEIQRRAILKRLLAAYEVDVNLKPDEVLQQSAAFTAYLETTYAPQQVYREWPLQMRDNGQMITGIADLVLETAQGLVVIDHKSFPGSQDALETKAQEYQGQLDGYARVLAAATGKPVFGKVIHFFTLGACVG